MNFVFNIARLAELADALDLGSSPERGMGSTPLSRTFHLFFLTIGLKTIQTNICPIKPT